jgi:hypothetical protein
MEYNSNSVKKEISDHIPDQRSGAAGGPVLSSHSLYSTQMFFFWRACQMKSTLAILAEKCYLIKVHVTFYEQSYIMHGKRWVCALQCCSHRRLYIII